MAEVPAAGGSRRSLPPGYPPLSPVALRLDFGSVGAGLDVGVRLVRRAYESGIRTFDVVGVPDPALAGTVLSAAFPTSPPDVTVLESGGRGGLRGAAPSDAPSTSAGVLRWGATDRPAAAPSRFPRLVEVGSSEATVGNPTTRTIRRCEHPEEVDRAVATGDPGLLAGPYSLLHRTLAEDAARAAGTAPFGWVVRDPFAGGRLDGSRFAPALRGGRPATPRSVRELEAEFAPVAPYRFLARTGRRTLAQASLQFLLMRPWVATICVPPPVVERWDELFRLSDALPLTDEERAAVEQLKPADGVADP